MSEALRFSRMCREYMAAVPQTEWVNLRERIAVNDKDGSAGVRRVMKWRRSRIDEQQGKTGAVEVPV